LRLPPVIGVRPLPTVSALPQAPAQTVTQNFLALGAGEAAARLLAFASTVYIARRLGAEYYGVIGFAAAVLLYLNRIVDFGIDAGLGVREIAIDRRAIERIAPAVLTLRLSFAVVVAALVVVAGVVVLPPPDGPILAVYGLTLVMAGASTRWIHLGLERASRVAIARTAGEAIMLVGVVGLVRGTEDLARVPLAQFVGDAAAALLLLWWVGRSAIRMPVTVDWTAVRPLMNRAWPLMLTALLGLLIYNSDLIFLRVFHGRAAVGYYAAAYTLVSFLINLGSAYGVALLPTLTGLHGDRAERQALYDTALARVVALVLPITVGGSYLAAEFVNQVFDEGYAAAAAPLAILLWSVLLLLVRGIPVAGLIAAGREGLVFRATAWAAALNLVLNVALIPRYGTVGAATATVLTEIARLVLAFLFAGNVGFGPTAWGRLWRPSVAGLAMILGLVATGITTLWIAVPLGAVVYGVALAMLGGIRWTRGALPQLHV